MKKSGNAPKRQMTPKEKINHHSKTIEMKFNEIHNILNVIDNTLKSFAEKLSQLGSIKNTRVVSVTPYRSSEYSQEKTT